MTRKAIRTYPGFAGKFRGRGAAWQCGDEDEIRENPVIGRTNFIMQGRLFVGLSVDDEPTYTLDDLVDFAYKYLGRRGGDPSSSFVVQKGVYQHGKKTKNGKPLVVIENSAQIVLLNFGGSTIREFTKKCVGLAEHLIRKMYQETIYVEIAQNGVMVENITVASQEYADRLEKEQRT